MVQNAEARLLTNTKERDHKTHILASLHWLPVKQRIVFKIVLCIFKVINSLAPEYIKDLLVVQSSSRLLKSNLQIMLKVPRTRLKGRGDQEFLAVAPLDYGMIFLSLCALQPLCRCSNHVLRPICTHRHLMYSFICIFLYFNYCYYCFDLLVQHFGIPLWF